MLGGRGIRLVLQAAYFLLIARALGAGEYGAFVGAVSLVALLAPFSSWGTGFLLIRRVARDRTAFSECWGTSLGLTVLSGAMLLGIVLAVARAIWGNTVPLQVLLLVGISDLIMVRTIDLATQAFMAVEVLRKGAEVNVMLSAARTLAALYFTVAAGPPTALSWAVLYMASSLAAAAYAIAAVTRSLGFPQLRIRLSLTEIRDGFHFALSQASQSAYNDIDKTMLVRLGGLEATGIYGAAYRIVDVSFAPVGALVYATFARFFQYGELGLAGSVRFARKLLPYAAGYGFLAALVLFGSAPLLRTVLGNDFTEATTALRWLSPLVLLKSFHYFLANSLTGAGAQGLTASVQTAVAAFNVGINLWLIPAYGWRGAAWASLATDTALALSLCAAIFVVGRKEESRAVNRLETPVTSCD
jgi:O-antigen/teichoic acid export membrane protein